MNNMKKIVKKPEDTNYELINRYVLFFGLVLVAVAFAIKDLHIIWFTVLISVGCSIIASAIVIYLTSRYNIKKAATKAIIDRWGLVEIYETRGIMNATCDERLEIMTSSLDIIAFGLKSLRDSTKSKLIEEKVKNGVKIRILSMNPEGNFVGYREKEEGDAPDNIKKSIINLAEWVEQLKRIAPDKSNVELKYYDFMTEDFYFCIDGKYLFTGPYLHGIGSQQTISYEYKQGEMLKFYIGYFNDLWESIKL